MIYSFAPLIQHTECFFFLLSLTYGTWLAKKQIQVFKNIMYPIRASDDNKFDRRSNITTYLFLML